jgi:hypothetical protein
MFEIIPYYVDVIKYLQAYEYIKSMNCHNICITCVKGSLRMFTVSATSTK